jgi:hypothetical protein
MGPTVASEPEATEVAPLSQRRYQSSCEFLPLRSKYPPRYIVRKWQLRLPHSITVSNSAFCIYGFRMILTVNSDHFLKQR